MLITRCPAKCVAKLKAGEIKRIPVSNVTYLVGYYMGCPACGRVQAIPHTEGNFVETGLDVGEKPSLSMGIVECTRCHVNFEIQNDEAIVHAS